MHRRITNRVNRHRQAGGRQLFHPDRQIAGRDDVIPGPSLAVVVGGLQHRGVR